MANRDSSPRSPPRLRSGSLVPGGYRIERRIAVGGMATVYEATHTETGRKVALKVLLELYRRDEVVVKRFVNEARAAMAVRSPHAVRIEMLGYVCADMPYIAMELLRGTDLLGLLKHAGGRLDVEHALYLVDQIAAALEAAHAAKVVHRDLKPENIFAVSTPAGVMVKVLDFGLSKRCGNTGTGLTKTGTTVGTPHYMSPEQLRGDKDIDGRADIYALGALTYELLSGRPPFEGANPHEVMRRAARHSAQPLSALRTDLPQGLVAVVAKAMQRDRNRRIATASELREALLPFWSGKRPCFEDSLDMQAPPNREASPAPPAPPPQPPPAPAAKPPTTLAPVSRRSKRPRGRTLAVAAAVWLVSVLVTAGVTVTVVDMVWGVGASARARAVLFSE